MRCPADLRVIVTILSSDTRYVRARAHPLARQVLRPVRQASGAGQQQATSTSISTSDSRTEPAVRTMVLLYRYNFLYELSAQPFGATVAASRSTLMPHLSAGKISFQNLGGDAALGRRNSRIKRRHKAAQD